MDKTLLSPVPLLDSKALIFIQLLEIIYLRGQNNAKKMRR
jgi:hypothetical protein